MSFVTTKSKFHVALDGVGLLLQGAPDRPAYQQNQAPVYGNRFASGDRGYDDLSHWWYFVQTDWSGGIKDNLSWEDDAKFFASTNIDVYSEPGAIKLAKGLVLAKDFTEDIWCGSYETIGADSFPYIGTKDDGGGKPSLYRLVTATWTDIISSYIPTTAEWVTDALSHKGVLWISTVGGATAETYALFKCAADGSSQTDYTTAIATAMGWTKVTGASAMISNDDVLYVAVQQYGTSKYGIVKTVDAGANWVKVIEFASDNSIPCLLLYGQYLLYLVEKSGAYELRQYDIVSSVDLLLQLFRAGYSSVAAGSSASRRLLHSFQGRVIITIPGKEIWSYLNGVFTLLIKQNSYKHTTLAAIYGEVSWANTTPSEAQFKGGIMSDNKIWWGNLMYDGSYFYNTIKNFDDTANIFAIPVFSTGTIMYWVSAADWSLLYSDSGYKGTADKNYIILSNHDIISGLDKLAYSLTLLFKPLTTGQKITIEYCTEEITSNTTWTVLGSVSYSGDGGSVSFKKILFGDSVIYKKMWLRIKLEGNLSTTPTLTDIVMEYLPMPVNKKLWNINVNCADNIKTLDGQLIEKTGREIKSLMEKTWWTKSIVDFQDLDYATTTITDNPLTNSATIINVSDTSDFPEQGRLRCEDEEITYTGKTPTTFTGCARGARSTLAASHVQNTVINNAYKVIVTELNTRVPITLEDKELEYIVGVSLREA